MSITYQKALEIIQRHIKPLHVTQKLPLLECINRICAEDIFAHFELPQTPISLRDGYGVHLHSEKNYTLMHTTTDIQEGHACKLFTGDTIPKGVNAVVADEEIDFAGENLLTCSLHVEIGHHIKRKGEDIAPHERLLQQGEYLDARKITAIASQGISHIVTIQKPKIGILSISKHLATTMHNSNAVSLGARIIELGGVIGMIEECHDENKIIPTLTRMSQTVDLIITTGAMSSSDMMSQTLNNQIFTQLFNQVDIAPAKPSVLSLVHQIPILHLPGFPLSCMLGFEMLGLAIVKRLQHQALPRPISLINAKMLTCKDDCVSAIPGYSNGNSFRATTHYEAGRLNALSQCNGYILVEKQEKIEEGESVSFFYFNQPPVS